MQYGTSKGFDKAYAKLSVKKQDVVDAAIELFIKDPQDPKLRLHGLAGEWKGHISISGGGDLRIHLIEKPDEAVIVFVAVGTHSQLYK